MFDSILKYLLNEIIMFNTKRSPESCTNRSQIHNSADSIMHFPDLFFFQNLVKIT